MRCSSRWSRATIGSWGGRNWAESLQSVVAGDPGGWGESLHLLGRIAPPTGANRSRGVAGLVGENLAFPAFRGAETLPEGLVRDLHVVMQASNQTKDLR